MAGDVTPPPGDPDGLVAAVNRWAAVGDDIRDGENRCRRALVVVEKGWFGSRAEEFTQSASGTLVEMVTVRDSLEVAGSALSDYARALRDAQMQVASLAGRYAQLDNRAGSNLDDSALARAARQQGSL